MSQKEFVFSAPIEILDIKQSFDYPIYAKCDNRGFKVLVEKNSLYSKKECNFYKNNQLKKVFITVKDKIKYQTDVQKYITNIVDNDDISANVKAILINDLAKDTIQNLFEAADISKETLTNVNTLLSSSIDFILKDELAIKSMLKVISYDYYTSTHCIDVATYALAFGAYLKLEKEELELLGKAALLHDLGKRKIDKNIICKNGKLTTEEFEKVKEHPTFSVKILKKYGETNQRLLDIIEQHHEKCDGTGYPRGLKSNEIDDFAKIIAICDIFHALTTRRSYKDSFDKHKAFMIMYEKMRGEICEDYLRAFLQFLKVT